jgi:putative FmdB family regulatory protein
MPVYEYRCTKCGGEWEALMGMSEPNPSCPTVAPGPSAVVQMCDGVVEKLISRSTFRMAKQEVK